MIGLSLHCAEFILVESSQDPPDIIHGNILLDELLQQIGHPGPQIHEKADETTRLRQSQGFCQRLERRRLVVL